MNIILNNLVEPTMQQVNDYFNDDIKCLWSQMLSHLQDKYNSKPSFSYSKCSGKPGWNLKFKFKSKALCTLYPDKDKFTALIVLNSSNMDLFQIVRVEFNYYLQSLFDNCQPFNNTKWLMTEVNNEDTLDNVRKLLAIKNS